MTTFTHRGYTVRLKRRNIFGGWIATVSRQSVAQSLFLGRQSGSKAISRMKSFVDLLIEQQAWIEALQPQESAPKAFPPASS
jgi:hypothetical protein